MPAHGPDDQHTLTQSELTEILNRYTQNVKSGLIVPWDPANPPPISMVHDTWIRDHLRRHLSVWDTEALP